MTAIKERILGELSALEQHYEVKILYACESGSRAWGFASTDSDYDVRFVYLHPLDWYLSIDQKRDVIERPISDELDLSGWELRKALRLLRKSNPPLLGAQENRHSGRDLRSRGSRCSPRRRRR